jgi:hypothetical protein
MYRNKSDKGICKFDKKEFIIFWKDIMSRDFMQFLFPLYKLFHLSPEYLRKLLGLFFSDIRKAQSLK